MSQKRYTDQFLFVRGTFSETVTANYFLFNYTHTFTWSQHSQSLWSLLRLSCSDKAGEKPLGNDEECVFHQLKPPLTSHQGSIASQCYCECVRRRWAEWAVWLCAIHIQREGDREECSRRESETGSCEREKRERVMGRKESTTEKMSSYHWTDISLLEVCVCV